jgi:hypothetical protein
MNISTNSIDYLDNISRPWAFLETTIRDAVDRIGSDEYKVLIDDIRLLDDEAYKLKKRGLPTISWNATFTGSIKNDSFKASSGLFHFDIDHLDGSIEQHKAKIASLKSCVFCFVSPSGKGLKAALRIDPETVKGDADFKVIFYKAQDMLSKHGYEIDESCKDVRRLCFISHDPLIYVNYEADEFVSEFTPPIYVKPEPIKDVTSVKVTYSDDHASIAIGRCVDLLQSSSNGTRHELRIKAGVLGGGYIAGGLVNEERLYSILLQVSDSISDKGITENKERQAIKDGIEKGKQTPIYTLFEQVPLVDISALLNRVSAVVDVVKPVHKTVSDLSKFPVDILNDAVDFFELLSIEPRRSITMQGVIAMTAVLAGRIYKSSMSNDSSLFLMTLADTGFGKGYPAKAIKRLFNEAGVNDLIQGSGNTSAAAVFSALKDAPCHIQMIDEIGKHYATAAKQPNGQLAEGFNTCTIAYSETDSVIRPRNYSTAGLTKAQLANRGNQFIVNPSMTLFGFATPEQVLNNLSTNDIDDGFLNRQIIVISDDKPLHEKDLELVECPELLIDWIKSMRRKNLMPHRLEDMLGVDTDYDIKPNFITVGYSQEAKDLLRAFKLEVDVYEGDDKKMAMRWRENAMRMCTAMAVAEDYSNPMITLKIAQWCIDYVRHHGIRFLVVMSENLADSDFHRLRLLIVASVNKAGKKGATESEISRHNRLFAHSTPQLRDQVFSSLIRDKLIAKGFEKSLSGRGRPREAYINFSLAEEIIDL